MMFSRFLKKVERIAKFNICIASSSIAHQNQVSRSKLYHVFSTVRCFQSGRFVCGDKSSSQHWSQSPTRVFGKRVSRAMKNEAQKALFDYLHHTRTLSFVDAEHISKNSPRYIFSLLSKIDTRKADISLSLTKFLRYNPINEFEPFFESLGLRPSEISRFLQRDLVLLSDDEIMFENFHVLCSYGIPRCKIGRLYREVREVFGYENGVLASKLEAYESLVLSKPVVIKLVNCCPSLLVGEKIDSDFVSVVNKLKGLNIGCDWLGRYLSDRKTYNWCRILETMELLHKLGYEGEKLSSLLKTYPELVGETSGNEAYVMFDKLHKVGFQMNEIYKLVIDHPEMLLDKSVKRILEALKFMRRIRMENQFIVMFLLCHMKLICSSSLIGPRAVWNRFKIGRDELCQIINEEPLRLFSLASKTKNRTQLDNMDLRDAEKTAFLLKLGYVENSDEMVWALKKFQGRGDELQERFDCLVKAGLDYNVVTELVKRAPHILNRPKDIIEKKIDILTDYLGYPVETLVESPTYVCYSMERIHQRFSMYIWLRKREAVIPRLTLGTLIGISNTRFVSNFVNNHPEGPATWESIKRASN